TTKIAGTLVAAAGLAIAAGVGYLLQKEAQLRSESRAVVTIVQEATVELERGLKMPSQEAVARVEGSLRVAQGWQDRNLVEDTEPYLVVVREHFDLDVQLNALASLLGSLPEANKRLAPHVQASLLLEDSKRRNARDA